MPGPRFIHQFLILFPLRLHFLYHTYILVVCEKIYNLPCLFASALWIPRQASPTYTLLSSDKQLSLDPVQRMTFIDLYYTRLRFQAYIPRQDPPCQQPSPYSDFSPCNPTN